MKSYKSIFLVICGVLLCRDICYGIHYETTVNWKSDAIKIIPVDVDGDNYDEFLVHRAGHFILRDKDYQAFWQVNMDTSFELLGGTDINKDGKKEIFVSCRKDGAEVLICFDSQGNKIKEIRTVTGKDIAPPFGWDGYIFGKISCINANDDNNPDIVFPVGTSFDLQPRGIYCFDFETGMEIWHFLTGPKPEIPIICDLDGDGYEEIIFGSSAPGNGSKANGTDDGHSYVFVIDMQGNLLWKHTITGVFSDAFVRVGDVDGDSKQEVITAGRSSNAAGNTSDSLFIFEGKTGTVKRLRDTGSRLRGIEVEDINHDGKKEIIVGSLDNKLRVFDNTLFEIKTLEYASKIELQDITDIDGNGSREIITSTGDKKIVIFNEKLEELFQIDFSDKNDIVYHYSIKDGNKKKFLLSVSSSLPGLREYLLVSSSKRFIPVPLNIKPWFIIIVCIVILVLLHKIISSYKRKNELKENIIIKDLIKHSPVGILIINPEGKILEINKAAEGVLHLTREDSYHRNFMGIFANKELNSLKEFLYSNISRGGVQGFPRESLVTIADGKVVKVIISKFENRVEYLVTLQDASHLAYTRRVAEWAPVAQKLAHGIKNPLNNIRLTIQQLARRYPETSEYSETILEEVSRLIKLTDSFMRFTNLEPPKSSKTNLNELLEDLIKKTESNLPDNVKIEFIPLKDLPVLELDAKQVEIAIGNILDNSVSAVGEKGFITVKTTFGESIETPPDIKAYVEIQISDTGRGIPKKELSNIFKPYFTTKPEGTGLGLCITKKIIEDHNGTINIQSKEGRGTTTLIRFMKR